MTADLRCLAELIHSPSSISSDLYNLDGISGLMEVGCCLTDFRGHDREEVEMSPYPEIKYFCYSIGSGILFHGNRLL